jgi:hypothetical protein
VSDWFSRYEHELRAALRAAAARQRDPRRNLWRSRAPLLVALALVVVAVPAVAAVTGAFKSERVPLHLRPGSGGALGPGCSGPGPSAPPPGVKGPAPSVLTRYFAALRRPATAADYLDASHLPHLAGVYTDAVRFAYEAGTGTRYYLVPAQNVNYSPPVPNTPACKAYRRLHRPAEPGVCGWGAGAVGQATGGGACISLAQLRKTGFSGLGQGFSYGMRPGTMLVYGLAADGIRAVVLRYPKRAPVRQVRIPVRSNVVAAVVRGRPEVGPAVYAETKDGLKLVQPGQQRTSTRQRELNKRSAARDLHATARPVVIPPVGRPHTTFTMRVRVDPLPGYAYVVRATGPPGLCRQAMHPFAYAPKRSGPTRGLIKVGIGYGPLGLHKMCVGHYRGTIRRVRQGARVATGTVVGRFTFEVKLMP